MGRFPGEEEIQLECQLRLQDLRIGLSRVIQELLGLYLPHLVYPGHQDHQDHRLGCLNPQARDTGQNNAHHWIISPDLGNL